MIRIDCKGESKNHAYILADMVDGREAVEGDDGRQALEAKHETAPALPVSPLHSCFEKGGVQVSRLSCGSSHYNEDARARYV